MGHLGPNLDIRGLDLGDGDDGDGGDDDGDGDGDDGDDGGGFADFTTNHLFSLLTASPKMPEPFYQFYTRVLPPILHQDTVHQFYRYLPTHHFRLLFWNSGWSMGIWFQNFIFWFGFN